MTGRQPAVSCDLHISHHACLLMLDQVKVVFPEFS
jgi:hypothetical protein